MSELKLVVFDLAGTTVKDQGQVLEAFVGALAEHRIEVSPEQLLNVRGSSKRQAVFDLVPEGPDRNHRAQSAYQSFCQRLAERYFQDGVEPMDGAESLFGWLRTKGVRVVLNTGFERDITNLLLESLKWNQGIVDAVVCGDDVPQGRPAPYMIFHAMGATGVTSVHAVANVGDTALDLQAGYNAGVRWNIGVLSGAHDRQRLESAPHTSLLPAISELAEFSFT